MAATITLGGIGMRKGPLLAILDRMPFQLAQKMREAMASHGVNFSIGLREDRFIPYQDHYRGGEGDKLQIRRGTDGGMLSTIGGQLNRARRLSQLTMKMRIGDEDAPAGMHEYGETFSERAMLSSDQIDSNGLPINAAYYNIEKLYASGAVAARTLRNKVQPGPKTREVQALVDTSTREQIGFVAPDVEIPARLGYVDYFRSDRMRLDRSRALRMVIDGIRGLKAEVPF